LQKRWIIWGFRKIASPSFIKLHPHLDDNQK
jgi:hypothetical protein